MAVYCRNCGASMAEEVRFCAGCGAATPVAANAYSSPSYRPLIRPRGGRFIGGVCQGIANQYRWDVAWVRAIAVISAIFAGGLGGVAYLVMWIVVPEEPLALPPGAQYGHPSSVAPYAAQSSQYPPAPSVTPYSPPGPPYSPPSGS